jgi:hypothetical protein
MVVILTLFQPVFFMVAVVGVQAVRAVAEDLLLLEGVMGALVVEVKILEAVELEGIHQRAVTANKIFLLCLAVAA